MKCYRISLRQYSNVDVPSVVVISRLDTRRVCRVSCTSCAAHMK